MKAGKIVKDLCRSLYDLRHNRFFAWIIGPLCLAIGPALNFTFSCEHLFCKLLKVVLVLWPSLGIAAWKFICACVQPALQTDDFEILLESLDQAVKKKKDRFLHKLMKFRKNKRKDYGKIFKEITKPEKQIELLMLGLYSVFREYAKKKVPNAKVWVVLFEFCGNKLRYLSYFKDRPCSEEQELLDEQSCVRKAKDLKNIIVVDDIQTELQKDPKDRCFKETSSKRNTGSIICFPVYDSRLNDSTLVISVWCDEKKVFVSQKAKIYSQILEKFADRILIEYGLLSLKKGNCHEREKK